MMLKRPPSKLVGLAILGLILSLYSVILIIALYTGDGLMRDIARMITPLIGLLPIVYLILKNFQGQ